MSLFKKGSPDLLLNYFAKIKYCSPTLLINNTCKKRIN